MAQVKVYGHREHLNRQRTAISNAIRGVTADELDLGYPVDV